MIPIHPMSESVIAFPLTTAQTALLSPLVLEAARNHQNMIFFSVVVPFRDQEEITWQLQTVLIPAKVGREGQEVNSKREQPSMTLPERIRLYLSHFEPAVEGQGGGTVLFKASVALVWGFALSPEQPLPYLQEFNQRSQT